MRFEREDEEEEIKNIRNVNGLIDYGKLMRKIRVKERKIIGDLLKNTFLTMIWEIYWKILKSQKIILKEIMSR